MPKYTWKEKGPLGIRILPNVDDYEAEGAEHEEEGCFLDHDAKIPKELHKKGIKPGMHLMTVNGEAVDEWSLDWVLGHIKEAGRPLTLEFEYLEDEEEDEDDEEYSDDEEEDDEEEDEEGDEESDDHDNMLAHHEKMKVSHAAEAEVLQAAAEKKKNAQAYPPPPPHCNSHCNPNPNRRSTKKK